MAGTSPAMTSKELAKQTPPYERVITFRLAAGLFFFFEIVFFEVDFFGRALFDWVFFTGAFFKVSFETVSSRKAGAGDTSFGAALVKVRLVFATKASAFARRSFS